MSSKRGRKAVDQAVINNGSRKEISTLAANELLSTSDDLPQVQVAHSTAGEIAEFPAHAEPVQPAERGQLRRRQGGGPRTELGKQRSRRNAIRHGIFAGATLLNGESRAQYQSLLTGLRERWGPDGFLEELLVEKLAMLVWRHRRMVQAESAEIDKACRTSSERAGNGGTFEERLREIARTRTEGLLARRPSSSALGKAVDRLTELRSNIAARGVDRDADSRVLSKVYGYDPLAGSPKGLFKHYAHFAEVTRVGDRMDVDGTIFCTPEEAKDMVTAVLDAEIEHLESLREAKEAHEDHRKEAPLTLPPEKMEQFLRYETHIERLFDRTLSQLERLQRMRLGQPVPPTLKVELSR